MFIKVSANGRVTLEDRDNFRAFKLVIDGSTEQLDAARKVLSGTAELLDSTHAWIFEEALRKRPETANDATWQQNLDAMVEKAKPHGWIDEQKKAIKAHIEWVKPA
jgi:hypothetical protein